MKRNTANYFPVLILVITINSSLYGIDRYLIGDTLFCIANGGLTLREEASFSGNILGVIPYGASVVAKQSKLFRNNEDTLKVVSSYTDERGKTYKDVELRGQWVFTSYKGKTGYAFDCYLSRYAAPYIWHDRNHYEYFDSYIARLFKLIAEEKKATDGYDEWILTRYYSSGITLSRMASKVAYSKWIIPKMSLEEIVIMLKNRASLTAYGTLRLTTLTSLNGVIVMEFADNEGGEGYIRVTSINGTIIMESEYWC